MLGWLLTSFSPSTLACPLMSPLFSYPHQRNFSLQQSETTAENHNQSKFGVVKLSPRRCMYKILLHLKVQRTRWKRGWKDCKKQGVCYNVVFPSSIKIYIHSLTNMTAQTWANLWFLTERFNLFTFNIMIEILEYI